jgi:hypothetical protein
MMKKINLKYGLIALLGLGISANVSALDYGCADITFTPEAYEAYEFVDQACLEMVERNGGVFAKFTARVVAQTPSGTHLRFRHADGELGPSHRYNPAEGFQTGVAGETVEISDVMVRTEFNMYVPATYWAAPVAEVAEVVEEAVAPPPPPPPPAPEPEPEPEPEMLPTTASSLPMLVLFGSLFLLIGGALRYSRKR